MAVVESGCVNPSLGVNNTHFPSTVLYPNVNAAQNLRAGGRGKHGEGMSGEPARPRLRPLVSRRWAILIVMCAALAAVIAPVASVNVALADVARETGATQAELQWLVDGYALVFAALLLPAGALGDRFGRRPVLLAGLVLFGAPAFASAAVESPAVLIWLRLLSGAGAALVMPVTLSAITDAFPEEQHGRAAGVWAGVAGLGGLIGLVAAGALLEFASWRAVFAMNGVLAGGVLLAALPIVPRIGGRAGTPIEVIGALLSAGGLGAIVYAITEGPQFGWTDPRVLAAFFGGVALLAGFVWWGLRAAHPLLDPRLFRLRGFATGTLALTMVFLAAFGFFFVFVQYLQWVGGYAPLRAGFAISPMAIGLIALSPFAAGIAGRWGTGLVTGGGLGLMALGVLLLAGLGLDSNYLAMLPGLVLLGAGLGLAMPPGTAAIVAAVPPEKRGVASAVNDAAREVGAALGIAIFGSMLNAGYGDSIGSANLALEPAATQAARESIAGALQIAADLGPNGSAIALAAREAFVHGFARAMYVGAAALAVTAVAAASLAPRRRAR